MAQLRSAVIYAALAMAGVAGGALFWGWVVGNPCDYHEGKMKEPSRLVSVLFPQDNMGHPDPALFCLFMALVGPFWRQRRLKSS